MSVHPERDYNSGLDAQPSCRAKSMIFAKLLAPILLLLCLVGAVSASEKVSTATTSDIAARIRDYQDNFNEDGPLSRELRYPNSLHFSEGLARCPSKTPLPLYGYVNKDRKLVIGQQFVEAQPFKQGLAAVADFSDTIVRINGKSIKPKFWGYIDHSGKYQLKLKPEIVQAENFSEGLAAAAIRDQKTTWHVWGYIDKSGNFVIPPRYSRAEAFVNGSARIAVPDRSKDDALVWGHINKQGKQVAPPKFVPITDFHEGLAVVAEHNPTSASPRSFLGYISHSGELHIKPRFAEADVFSEGLASVGVLNQNKTNFGFINRTGQFVIPPKFSTAGRFSEGLAPVRISSPNQRTAGGFIDKTGKFKIGPDPTISMAQPFSEGLAAVLKNEKWGYIDRTGRWVIPPTFNFSAYPFHNGVAMGIDRIAPKQPMFGMLLTEPHKKITFVDRDGKRYPAPEPDTGRRR